MKKIIKAVSILAAVCVGVFALAAIAVRIFLPPEKVKAMAIDQADKTLHRKLEIRDVSVGLVSGLRIEGLRLSETPDFSAGEFLTADRIVVSPELLPLLSKQLVARKVELVDASLNVIKGRDGKFNFSDLTGNAAPAKPEAKAAPGAAAAPLALTVDVFRLEDVAIHYVDKKQGTKADLGVKAVEIENFRPAGSFPLLVELHADYAAAGKKYDATLSAKGTVDLGGGDPAKFSLDLSRVALSSLGKQVDAALKVDGMAKPKIALSAQTPALDDKFLGNFASVPAGITVPPIKASAALAYSDPRLDISSLKISAAGAEIDGSGSVADVNAKSPRVALKISSNKIPLSSLADAAASMKQFGLGGTIALDASVSGDASAPKANGTLSIDGVGASYQGQVVEKVTGQVKFTQDSVDAPQLTGRVNGGDFKLKLAAGNPAAPYANLSGSLSLLDLGALSKLSSGSAPAKASPEGGTESGGAAPAKSGPPLKTSGDFVVAKIVHPNFSCGTTTLSWNLTGVSPDARRLNGAAKFNVGAGQATSLAEYAASSKSNMLKALLAPLVALKIAHGLGVTGVNLPDPSQIRFDRIFGNYTFTNGVMSMQPSQLDSHDLGLSTTGTIDLVAKVDNLKAMFTPCPIGHCELDITGPMMSPKVTPNLAEAAKAAVKHEIQNQIQQQLKDPQKLLKGLFH